MPNPSSRHATLADVTDQSSWQIVPHRASIIISIRPDPKFPPAFNRINKSSGCRLRLNMASTDFSRNETWSLKWRPGLHFTTTGLLFRHRLYSKFKIVYAEKNLAKIDRSHPIKDRTFEKNRNFGEKRKTRIYFKLCPCLSAFMVLLHQLMLFSTPVHFTFAKPYWCRRRGSPRVYSA